MSIKNYMPLLAKALGVRLYERFRLNEVPETQFYIDPKGFWRYANKRGIAAPTMMVALLTGKYTIKKEKEN